MKSLTLLCMIIMCMLSGLHGSHAVEVHPIDASFKTNFFSEMKGVGWKWGGGGEVLQSEASGLPKGHIVSAFERLNGETTKANRTQEQYDDFRPPLLTAVKTPAFGSGSFLRTLQNETLTKVLLKAFDEVSFAAPKNSNILAQQLTLLTQSIDSLLSSDSSAPSTGSAPSDWASLPGASSRIKRLLRDAQDLEAETITKVANKLASVAPVLNRVGLPPLQGQVASITVAWSNIIDPSPRDFIALYMKGPRDENAAIDLLKGKIELEKTKEISKASERGERPVRSIKRAQLEAQLESILSRNENDDRFEFIAHVRNRASLRSGLAVFTVVNTHAPFVFRYYRSPDGPESPWPWFHGRPALLPKRAELLAESNTLQFARGQPLGIHLVPDLDNGFPHEEPKDTVGIRIMWTSDRNSAEGAPQVEWEPAELSSELAAQNITDIGDTRFIPQKLLSMMHQFSQRFYSQFNHVKGNMAAATSFAQELLRDSLFTSRSFLAAKELALQDTRTAQRTIEKEEEDTEVQKDDAAVIDALKDGASTKDESHFVRGPMLNLDPHLRTDDDVAAHVRFLLSPQGIGQMSWTIRQIQAEQKERRLQLKQETSDEYANGNAFSGGKPKKARPTRGGTPLDLLSRSLSTDLTDAFAFEQTKGDDLGWGNVLSSSSSQRAALSGNSFTSENDFQKVLKALVAKYNSDSVHWRLRNEPGPLSGARAGFPRLIRPRSGRSIASSIVHMAATMLHSLQTSDPNETFSKPTLSQLISQSVGSQQANAFLEMEAFTSPSSSDISTEGLVIPISKHALRDNQGSRISNNQFDGIPASDESGPPGSNFQLQFSLQTLTSSSTYTAQDMCGPPANITSARGYQFPGHFHAVDLKGLKPGQLYRYRVGQAGVWSSIHLLRAPPAPLSPKPKNLKPSSLTKHDDTVDDKPIRILMLGDHGVAGCFAHSLGCLGSSSVAAALAREISSQSVSATASAIPVSLLVIVGDVSYATGRTLQWKRFMAQSQVVASHIPTLITPGNHEYDVLHAPRTRVDISGVTFPGFRPAFLRSLKSGAGGECGVPAAFHFPAPRSRAPVEPGGYLHQVLKETRAMDIVSRRIGEKDPGQHGIVAEARTHAEMRARIREHSKVLKTKLEESDEDQDSISGEEDAAFTQLAQKLTVRNDKVEWLESNSIFWYAHLHGPVLFIGLSAEHSLGVHSPQRIWLEATLRAARGYVDDENARYTTAPSNSFAIPNLWIIVNIHRPMYCSHRSGYHFGHGPYLRSKLEPLFQLYRVDMVVTGHFHAYQRTCPVHDGRCNAPLHSVFQMPAETSQSRREYAEILARSFEDSGQVFARDPEVYFQPAPPEPGTTLSTMQKRMRRQRQILRQSRRLKGAGDNYAVESTPNYFGTIHILAGVGGIAHEGVPFLPAPWSRVTDKDHFGFLRTTFKGVNSLSVEFVGHAAGGKTVVVDSFVIAREFV